MAEPWKGVLRNHVPDSNQLVGLLTLVIFGGIFVLLAGATLTFALLAFAFLGPILLLTSPIWLPAAIFLFVVVAITLSACGFAAAGVAGAIWSYRYVNVRARGTSRISEPRHGLRRLPQGRTCTGRYDEADELVQFAGGGGATQWVLTEALTGF
ncbi:oleosin-like [Curcuma longa]|uniref:oleosin-like n=1 Tax=Curcuma longa TaxID=136217 RepID=UPI003D9E341A